MKRILLIPIFLYCVFCSVEQAYSQNPGEWVWMHGSNAINSSANFGIQGVPSPSNEPPSLYEACEWTDLLGNLWLYGGQSGSVAFYADLWKYDTGSNEWTWINGPGLANQNGYWGVQGVSSPLNTPGARGWAAASWVDKNGNFWMFGGRGFGGGDMNDLWVYDVSSYEWTWMKGSNTSGSPGSTGIKGVPDSTNNPSARHEIAAAWTDNNGDLWMFGGFGSTQTDEVWRFNIASNMWTWLKGLPSSATNPVWGTINVPDSLNTPGARNCYSRWVDSNGNLWLFGGVNYNVGVFNDLWKYDITTGNWTWMKGPNYSASPGNYGTACVETSSNLPPSRFENRSCWTDACGDFWMCAGADAVGSYNTRNDLWKYSVATNNWAWINGSQSLNPLGNYGIKGVSAPTNSPRSRFGSLAWRDLSGRLWMFGGAIGGSVSTLNDLWAFAPNPSCGACSQALPVASYTSSDTAFCNEGGKCIDFFDHSAGNPTAWKWLFPGAIPDTSTQQNPTTICYFNPGTYAVTLIVSNAAGVDTLAVSPMITLGNTPPTPTITLSGNDTLVCSPASAYQWYYNGVPIPAATDSFYVATNDGNYNVYITDSIGCSRLGSGILFTAIKDRSDLSGIEVYPNPAENELTIIGYPFHGKEVSINIINTLGEILLKEKVIGNDRMVVDIKPFSHGIYFIRIADSDMYHITKFVKK